MTSVVIAAHNEEAVIGRCLDALLAGAGEGEFDITVVANGCRDRTVEVASARRGARVIDLSVASKPAALNAGDRAARGFPRIYLDADIVLSTDGLRALAAAVGGPTAPGQPAGTALAAMPRRALDVAGRPLLVRAYFAINSRHPAYRDGLFGRGAIAVSAAGRARFDEFPNVVADDLFLDGQFSAAEKREVSGVVSRIATPRRTADLMRRLVRVRGSNAALRAAAVGQPAVGQPAVRPTARWGWLRSVVLPRPWLAPAAVCYIALTVVAGSRARRTTSNPQSWGRDDSSRQVVPAASEPAGEPDV